MIDITIFPRLIEPHLVEALADSPAVLIQGPRQCGKTTLARMVGASHGYKYVTFDDDVVRSAAQDNRLSRLVKRPKLHLCDTGVASALLGMDGPALAYDRSLFGQLLETFVFQELRRQASWHDERMSFHHFRDKDGTEVDIVIESGAMGLAGVEVKASGTVRPADFRGLRKLQGAIGDRFAGGVVLYDGEATVPFGERLHAVPVRRLIRG